MRNILAKTMVLVIGVVQAGMLGCSEEPIGQPCTFGWPTINGAIDCTRYPVCHPLQKASEPMENKPSNNACPVDCIQQPTLECDNLICVTTSIIGMPQHINGQCSVDVPHEDCSTAPYACMGYCTKECVSDCPKGYSCVFMAPFAQNLNCDDTELWGDGFQSDGTGDTSLKCTADCKKTGTQVIPDDPNAKCPSSRKKDNPDYSLCDLPEYSKCCTCICYRYCPLKNKKFCRKTNWDQEMFPNGQSNASCGQEKSH